MTDEAPGIDTADWDIQMEATTQNIMSIIRQLEKNMNEQMDGFKDEIEKMALDVDIQYKEINLNLNALRQNEAH